MLMIIYDAQVSGMSPSKEFLKCFKTESLFEYFMDNSIKKHPVQMNNTTKNEAAPIGVGGIFDRKANVSRGP